MRSKSISTKWDSLPSTSCCFVVYAFLPGPEYLFAGLTTLDDGHDLLIRMSIEDRDKGLVDLETRDLEDDRFFLFRNSDGRGWRVGFGRRRCRKPRTHHMPLGQPGRDRSRCRG